MTPLHRPLAYALLTCATALSACVDDSARDPGNLEDGGSSCAGGKCDDTERTGPCYEGPICDRFEACLGPGWGVGEDDPDWAFKWDTGLCRARLDQGNNTFTYPDDIDLTDDLLRSVTVRQADEDFGAEAVAACAVLEQARSICKTGSAVGDNGTVYTGLCHPNADLDCRRYEPTADDFVGEAAVAFSGPMLAQGIEEAGYCMRQVAGDCNDPDGRCGYPLTYPQSPPRWECDDTDVTRLTDILADRGNRLMGRPYWSVGSADSNTCRVTKALVDCVLPNLGDQVDTGCSVPNADSGTSYSNPAYGGFCFDIQHTTQDMGDPEVNAHTAGRALDFNVPDNNGNLGQCDLGCDWGRQSDSCYPDPDFNDANLAEYLCTNRERPIHADLPPRFISLMEGCGFTWGGRWGDPAQRVESEGRYLGCDPMHFELP